MKRTAFIMICFVCAACTHPAPPVTEGRLLDDAELASYGNRTSSEGQKRAWGVTNLGQGEVDLSKWKSKEEAAAAGETAPGAAGGSQLPATGDGATTVEVSPAGDGGVEMTQEADDVADDAGGRVEEDVVELVPSDE